MSQLSINCFPALEPTSFEHPHLADSYQVNEFWQQYPTWALPSQLQHSYPRVGNNYYKYAMDEQRLVIGYKTRNGKRLPPGQKNANVKSTNNARPKGKIDIYIDETFIKQVPLGLMVRFSTTAQEAFPKPPKKGFAESKDAESKEAVKSDWAEDEEEKVDVEKLTTDIANLSHGTQSDKDEAAKNVSKNRRLEVRLDTLWTQPPVDAFMFAFDWMHAAKSSKGDDLLEFGVPEPDRLSLEKLVDLYAAALCLGLRPKPNKHRTDIFTRLTKTPPSLQDIIYIHEHLPVNDSIMTRAITSFLKNRGAMSEVYEKNERVEIETYFSEVDADLYNRFKDILEYREGQRRAHLRDQGALRLQKLAEGTEPFIDDQKAEVRAEDVSTSPIAEGGGRRRGRKQQQRGAKKPNGGQRITG